MQVDDAFPNYFLKHCIQQVRFSLRRKLQKRAQLHVTLLLFPTLIPLHCSYNNVAIRMTASCNPASFFLAVVNASMAVAAASATTLLRQRR
jgi:hypothetical protein